MGKRKPTGNPRGRPRKVPIYIDGLPETVAPAQVEKRTSRKHSDMVRREAGIVFVTDPHGVSVSELHQDPRFQSVPLNVLQDWCTEDRWLERRHEVFEKWRHEVEDRLGSEMAKARIAEIRELHKVRKLALEKLYSPATAAKSWEGVARSLLEINARLEELASSVGREVLPSGPNGAPAIDANMRSDLSIEEVRAASREVLKLRRNAIRAALPSTETSAPEKKAEEPEH